MAAAFRPVNTPLTPADSIKEETIASPTTPRPSTAPIQPLSAMDEATTPTQPTFRSSAGPPALASQKPLPTSPFPDSVQVPDAPEGHTPKRENSQHSRKSKDSDDMDMDESDGEGAGADEGAGSDDESVNADGSKSNKKKKSQRFYCTDYPPCNLSFTRSEHLARHIRKHTGERPFQCHCSRRFSRLDNLRQHAQTVHVNEDIPIDSLAATGTRFQRQIRTERVRPTGRARASTAGSVGPASRGHSKSLSTSSIASVSSIGSTYTTTEARRRPAPLVMADPRSRLSLESYRTAEAQFYQPPSPSDFSTPTTATFSTGQNSPRWGSGVASPTSSHARTQSMYTGGSRTPGRRLSVPSGGNPFQSPHGVNVRGPHFGPGSMNSSNSGAFSPGQSSLLSSPTASPASTWSRRDSASSAADEAWRRRTWHPDSRDYTAATSRLSQVINQSHFPTDTIPPPVANPAAQSQQNIRLPGISSFDPIPHRPATPPRRNPSPMMIDAESSHPPPSLLPSADAPSEDRRSVSYWDMNLHRGLTRLDINTPPRDSAGAWANEVNQAVMAQAERVNPSQPTVRFDTEVKTVHVPTSMPTSITRHQHTMSAPSITTPRDSKRHGWYHGPVTVHAAPETIPEGRAHVDRIVHPNVQNFQGFPARELPPVIHQPSGPGLERVMERPHQSGNPPDSLRRLEALVAVATSEGSTAAAY